MILVIATIIEIIPWHLVNQPKDSILLKIRIIHYRQKQRSKSFDT